MTLRADTAELDDMEIAPGYTVSNWKALDLSGDDVVHWFRAIKIFETRIRRRFLDPVDVLIAHEIGQERGTFGFAILAIDCLLVESLQRFREGRTADGESGHLIRTFLHEQLGSHFDDGNGPTSKAGAFYRRCRCGLHHSGQTDGDFRVRRSGALIEFNADDSVVVNRTTFHDALKRVFDAYLVELDDPANGKLRKKFQTKMDAICGISAKAPT